jgi:UPF0755 protein
MTKKVLSLILLGATLSGLALVAWTIQLAATPLNRDSKTRVIVQIQRGQSPLDISQQLQSLGVINSSRQFYWLGRLNQRWNHIKAGEYDLGPSMSAAQVFDVLTSGVSVMTPLTIKEGANIFEIAQALENLKPGNAGVFLNLCNHPKQIKELSLEPDLPMSLEGYLFPDTYYLSKTVRPEELILQMYRRFKSMWNPKDSNRLQELNMTLHQLITLASIIEKETGNPNERGLISSVFHNRLRRKMRLQSDPTIIYGMGTKYKGALSKSDILTPSAYNTYTVDSLPVGPISNPGKEAIHAALYPDSSDLIFFVSQNDGTSTFSRTLEEHNAAVRKFQLDPKAREGKSWRDLKANH